jgi:hypothetical protein
MTSDERGKQLHDRATRGLPLSTEEQAALTAWYARHDEEEGRALSAAAVSSSLTVMREQVNATLAQIAAVAQRIQTVNKENEAVRNEIALLEQRLIPKTS